MPNWLSRTAVALRLKRRVPPAQPRPALPPQPKPKTFISQDGSSQIDHRKAQQKPWTHAKDGKPMYVRSKAEGPSKATIWTNVDERRK